MPLPGSLGASPSCLRCQLRQVILATRLRTTPQHFHQRHVQICQGFSTSLRRCQNNEEEEEGVFLKSDGTQDERRTRYRREYPIGRIVGQRGRRQRERSQTLSIDSMKKPFDVVLMQDIREPKEETPPAIIDTSEERDNGSSVTAAEVADGLLNRNQTPGQDEVDDSIDALRPDASTIEEHELKSLSRQLAEGYNIQQLSLYLMKAGRSSPIQPSNEHRAVAEASHGTLSISTSSWRAGRTRIERRHTASNAVKNIKKGQGKKRITEQILRSAWNLTVREEEQATGELEMSLQSWQFHYLFDHQQDGKPYYEHLVQSQILLQRSEVLLHKPDLTMRIVARQQDAEEIARLVQRDLREMSSLAIDLTIFKPMLGKSGWPKRLADLFPKSRLRYIGQHTKCVLDQSTGDKLEIFSKSSIAREQAQRLVLSMLHLPSPTSVETSCSDDSRKKQLLDLPEGTESGLHYRDRGVSLSRFTMPVPRSTDAEVFDETDRSALATTLVDKFKKIKMSVPYQMSEASTSAALSNDGDPLTLSLREQSYWHAVQDPNTMPWEVQICRILQFDDNQTRSAANKTSSPKRTIAKLKSPYSVVHADVPGINTLLSYFEPFDEDRYAFDSLPKAPSLVAHFFPSPFEASGIEALHALPRIELWYQVASRDDQQLHGVDSVRLSHVKAILHQRELRAVLPNEAVDLRILHRCPLTAEPDKAAQDDEIQRFSETLRQSASIDSGALAGLPSLKIELPVSVAQGGRSKVTIATQSDDVEIDYLFEGFEQVQTAAYAPLQPDNISTLLNSTMEEFLHSIPDSVFLEYKAIEGGIIGGNTGELTLKYKDTKAFRDMGSDEAFRREGHLQLVELALFLTDILTKISAGEIDSLQGSTSNKDE